MAGLVVSASPAAAADATGAFESVDSYPKTDDGFSGVFSADLSTLAVILREDRTPAGIAADDLVIVDTVADRRRVLALPDRIASADSVIALNADGSLLLVSADWEGIEPGDEDGGFADAFVVDTSSGAVELLTGSLDDVAIQPLSLDAAGDTVLFASYATNTSGDGSLMLWDGGVLTDVTPPINPLSDGNNIGLTTLTGDGQSLLYGTRAGFQSVWRLRNLSTGDEVVVAAAEASRPTVSDDGQIVMSANWRSDGDSDLFVWDTSTTRIERSVVPFQSPRFLSADGSTIAGVSNNYGDEEDGETALWSHDIATGVSEQLVTSRNVYFGFDVVGVDQTGDRMAFTTAAPLVRSGPITLDELFNSTGAIDERLYIFDRNAVPEPAVTPGYSGTLDDQMARLYRAYFNRAPDAGGLQFWREQRAGGRSINSVSGEFARSPEFVATYGDLGDEAFVDLVYRNVLDRMPDEGGRAFWLDQLANGRSRGSLMTLFSESPEFIAATQTSTPENPTAAAVRRLYASFFVRDADPAGLSYWVGEAERGVPLVDISERFYRSDEFQSFYRDLEGDAFTLVRVAYFNTFNRDADVEGYEMAGQVVNGQITVAEMLLQIANLPEFVALTSSTPAGG